MAYHEVNGPMYETFGANMTVVDRIVPEMAYLVDPYWNQFPPMNPLWYGILAIFMTVMGFISVSGNFVVIYIFSSTKSLRTPSNLFVVNLAISDFFLMFCMTPPLVVSSYYETWVFGPLMCEVYAMIGSLLGSTSIWTMTMIAFDRYNVIVKGLAGKPLTNTGAMIRILGIWLFSLFWTIAPMFGWSRYVPEGNMTACGTDYITKDWFSRSYILAYSVFVYFAPLLLIIYSYYYIIKAVSEHEKAMREQAKKMNVASLRSADDANKSAEAKLAKVALVTISLWFLAWTPYLVINYAGIFETFKLSPLATIWGSVFAKANACYNPIVYGISHPKYRAVLFQKLPCLECGSNSSANAADNQSQVTSQEKSPA